MASKTAQTEFRRALRRKNAGKGRKHAIENKGSTPVFPIHTTEADANAPKEQLSPSSRGE